MEKRAITQPANAVLPGVLSKVGFEAEKLLAPEQALVAFFSRVRVAAPPIERVPLNEAFGRIIASTIAADDDYPEVPRSAMDGFAVASERTPGTFDVRGEVVMGTSPDALVARTDAARIPTGGVVPAGADAIVPIEEARINDTKIHVQRAFATAENVIECGADMRRGEALIAPGTRILGPQAGLLASLGFVDVDVYRRPIVAVLSSGDELVEVAARPRPGQVRDSNRYAIAATLSAMGALPRHYPKLADDLDAIAGAVSLALRECDAVAVSGGTSVGARDALPAAVARLGEPGIVVHGLRVKPGKPTLLAALGGKPILGLPGNPASALMMLEGVAAPIVAALTGARAGIETVSARLAEPLRSRAGWTWYVPVALQNEGGVLLAHPLPVRSFSVSLAARAGGYVVMDERDEAWPAGTPVSVHRFSGAA